VNDDPRLEPFQHAYAVLVDALKTAPEAQIELLGAVDALYAAMDEAAGVLEDQQVLDAQIMLRHAESLLTRYFGM
jgi:hypothetical protein